MNATVSLASKSPQRRQLLEQIGLRYELLDVNVEEHINPAETPQQYVTRLAIDKAKAGWLSLKQERNEELQQGDVKQERKSKLQQGAELPVIGADTCITVDELILGKPRDRAHGLSMLKLLSGKTHRVYSAVSIIGFARNNHTSKSPSNGQDRLKDPLSDSLLEEWRVNESQVTMRKLSSIEIEDYWNTGEPVGKAGGYAVQGLAAKFISHLSGSYSAVMGLPLFELAELLQIFGIRTEVPDA
jgi:septum formation protein